MWTLLVALGLCVLIVLLFYYFQHKPVVELDALLPKSMKGHTSPVLVNNGHNHWIASWQSYDTSPTKGVSPNHQMIVSSGDNGASWTNPNVVCSIPFWNAGIDPVADLTRIGKSELLMVWPESEQTTSGLRPSRIKSATSTDNGQSWTGFGWLPLGLMPTNTGEVRSRVIPNQHGGAIALWSQKQEFGDCHYVLGAQWNNSDRIWTQPFRIESPPGNDLDGDINADASESGVVVAMWTGHDSQSTGSTGSNYNVWMSLSRDAGTTWTTGQPFGHRPNPALFSAFPAVKTDQKGTWAVAFYRTRVPNGTVSDICIRISRDDANSWPETVWIQANNKEELFHGFFPVILETDSNGNWVLVWTNRVQGEMAGQSYYVTSNDNGLKWSNPRELVNFSFASTLEITAMQFASSVLPRNPPYGVCADGVAALSTDRNGTWLLIYGHSEWSRMENRYRRSLRLLRSMDNGESWKAL
ncbi:MAG: glycoside hydrolase [Candidatus Sumerlaeaceae bacterium]|nr:glycoside hydrolase [Candidatus Sumerlaeaceae bacterium]